MKPIWDNHYPTNDPCDICGKIGENGIEPRFGYTTCEKHKDLPPAHRHIWRKIEGYKKK